MINILRTKWIIGWLLFLAGLLVLSSCISNNNIDNTKNRTVLVYMAADNSLWGTANSNIYSMNSCIANGMDKVNLLAYVDNKGANPVLLHIHNTKIDTVNVYPEHDSTDPQVLRMVIDEVTTNWEAERYGLVLWSHGTGWLPTSKLHYVASNKMGYVQQRGGERTNATQEGDMWGFFNRTKAFAWEDRREGNPKYTCMELNELARAIPDGVFDFILFDACYMGNVEVLYELRNKADYIISSCFEIVSFGFPYHIVTRDILNGSLLKTCKEFYDYYNTGFNDWKQMAGVSLVKTDELDSLARCFRKVVNENRDRIPDMNVSNIQHFDRFDRHVFYDMEDFVDKLGTRKELLNEFRLQLEQCVTFKISTPYVFPGDIDSLKIDEYCGMSVYIPLRKYDASGLNDDYRQTEWSMDTDY